jgi:hypothetical protein
MTGTLKTTLIQNPSSADVNITLGTSGEVTLAKSPVLNGSTSGTLTIAAPAVAGTNTQTLVAATGTLAPLISGTAVASTSGTSIDFTSIPSWVKRITVMFSGVSTSGTSNLQIQLGAGTIQSTSYDATAAQGDNATTVTSVRATSGFIFTATNAAANLWYGNMTITSFGSNTWTETGALGRSVASNAQWCAGGVTLSGTLDRVRITTINGTDTFDAGSINILYE